jgi:hypothetical protein
MRIYAKKHTLARWPVKRRGPAVGRTPVSPPKARYIRKEKGRG